MSDVDGLGDQARLLDFQHGLVTNQLESTRHTTSRLSDASLLDAELVSCRFDRVSTSQPLVETRVGRVLS
jgi:hypothetical protein